MPHRTVMDPVVRFILISLFVVFVLYTVVNILLLLIALFLCFVLVAYPFLKRALKERERRSDQLQVKSKNLKNRQKRECFPPNSKLKVKRLYHVYEVYGDGNFKFLVRNNEKVLNSQLAEEDWTDLNEKLSECLKKWPRGFKHKPGGTMRIDEQGTINKDINGINYRFVNVQVQKNIKRRKKRRGDSESTTVALVLIPHTYQVCSEYVHAAIDYSVRTRKEVIICPQETKNMEIESQVPSYIK